MRDLRVAIAIHVTEVDGICAVEVAGGFADAILTDAN